MFFIRWDFLPKCLIINWRQLLGISKLFFLYLASLLYNIIFVIHLL